MAFSFGFAVCVAVTVIGALLSMGLRNRRRSQAIALPSNDLTDLVFLWAEVRSGAGEPAAMREERSSANPQPSFTAQLATLATALGSASVPGTSATPAAAEPAQAEESQAEMYAVVMRGTRAAGTHRSTRSAPLPM